MDNLTVNPEDWQSVIVAPPPQPYPEDPYEEWAITFTCDPKKEKFEEWKHNALHLTETFLKENFLEHEAHLEYHLNGHPHVHAIAKLHPGELGRIRRDIKKFAFFYGYVDFRKCWNVEGWKRYIRKYQNNNQQ